MGSSALTLKRLWAGLALKGLIRAAREPSTELLIVVVAAMVIVLLSIKKCKKWVDGREFCPL